MKKKFHAVRGLREAIGISQQALADELEVTGATICQIERGAIGMSAALGLRMVDSYRKEMTSHGVTLEDLLRSRGNVSERSR